MAIDPTTPVTPILPSVPAGAARDSVVVQAVARQALVNATAQLSEIVGRSSTANVQAAGKAGAPVEQAGQASAQDAGQAADASTAKAAPTTPSGATTRPAAETLLVRAVRVAAAEAVPRQQGLAPLMANVRSVVERPDMPVEVREAGKALLAQAPPAAELTTPQGLRQAVERSGVFLEAHMARAAPQSVSDAAARTTVGEPDMKAALLVFRGALSAWLARATPAATDAAPVEAAPTAPPVASQDMEGEATQVPPASPSIEASEAGDVATPHALVQSSTTSTQSPVSTQLAEPSYESPPTSAAKPAGVSAETAAAPTTTAAMVAPPTPAADDAIAARFATFVTPPKTTQAPQAPMRSVLSALVQLGLMAEEAPTSGASITPEAKAPLAPRGYGAPTPDATRSKVPPPPYAGGPMAGQKAERAEIPAETPVLDTVRRLLKGASGALARQDLMQIASLPEPHGDHEAVETRPQQGARLNLDLPFVTPQGVSVAQFEISHDGGGSGGGAAGPIERTYKARFSIDVEPLGPVHALVTLTGSRTRVSLWAERAETIARLRAGEESLAAGLREADLAPEVAVHSGAPPTPGVSPLGHFVDQAS